jgi:hypothetical protein
LRPTQQLSGDRRPAYKEQIHKAILDICDTGEENKGTRLVEEICVKEIPNVSLWQHLDVHDFSAARFFVTPYFYSEGAAVFEVDFLSRHEIMPPMTKDNVPASWLEWGVVVGSHIHVIDREAFVRTILTSEMFLALPKHRFEALSDDIQALQEEINPPGTIQAIFDALINRENGYSFLLFLDNLKSIDYFDGTTLSYVHSCLEGKKYENTGLCRLASEQLQLRSC